MSVPRPNSIVHDVAMFLLHPSHQDAAGRGEWERARAAIAKLANEPCAAVTRDAVPCSETKILEHAPAPPSNVVRLFPRHTRVWT